MALKSTIKNFLWQIVRRTPGLGMMYYTRGTQNPITLKYLFWQKILGFNRAAYWPMHFTSTVVNPENVFAGVDVSPGYSPGCYIQAIGKVYIGNYTQIGPNVGIISANHELYDTRNHVKKLTRIGDYSWIGMNSVILPGVTLGDFTIVAAGSIVSKSFEEGYCVIGGNPARILKQLDKSQCQRFKNRYEYFGYVSAEKFESFRKRHLTV